MEYREVESSNIAALAHSGTTLAVKFHNGTEYHYSGVPVEIFDQLIQAASVGRTFNELIKSRPDDYPYNRAA